MSCWNSETASTPHSLLPGLSSSVVGAALLLVTEVIVAVVALVKFQAKILNLRAQGKMEARMGRINHRRRNGSILTWKDQIKRFKKRVFLDSLPLFKGFGFSYRAYVKLGHRFAAHDRPAHCVTSSICFFILGSLPDCSLQFVVVYLREYIQRCVRVSISCFHFLMELLVSPPTSCSS